VKPFPTQHAIDAIERVTGKKISELFSVFDPSPIGSASLSCVYQAVRKDGQKVAVKVRRPGIGRMLAADLKALGWVMDLAESLSVVRTGITRNLRIELHSMLMEELNFLREARYTELFRKRSRKKKQHHITAPRVFRDMSGEDVLVTEFVSGVFLWEIISALDKKDATAINLIRTQGIDPREIARRMVLAFNWETLENIFFHADPHPANIVIKPDNTIVFIDFGSCGRFSSKTRRLWMQLHHYLNEEDVQGMVESSISILEPLPPIDLDRFIKEVEGLYWDWLYALSDKDSEWWEKASGMMWMTFVGIARNYNIPMNLDTLRLFRATFLYDTIMYRLWREMDLDTEYQRYHRQAAKRAKRRVRKSIRRRVEEGLQVKDYLRLEETVRMGRQALGRIQHVLDTPSHNFSHMLGKAAFGVSIFLKLLALGMGIHVLAVIAVTIYQSITGIELSIWDTFKNIVASEWYQIGLMLVLLVIVRKVLMRFEDIDIEKN
jgi:predicted unusual protein kinase regulating ubiquinone biosynthesis (AarF/ABC1/UbiB family)